MHCLFLLAIGGRPADNLSIFDPASPPAASIRQLFILVTAVTAVIFLLVEGVLVYSLFRFRQLQWIVMAAINLVFFLYLVRPEVTGRLRRGV